MRVKERLSKRLPVVPHPHPTTAKEILENLLTVLTVGKWTKSTQLRVRDGAVCLIGGLRYAAHGGDGPAKVSLSPDSLRDGWWPEPENPATLRAYLLAERRLRKAITQVNPFYASPIGFNDAAATKRRDVIRVVETALGL